MRLIYVRNSLTVGGDAAATANNIAARESVLRWGIARIWKLVVLIARILRPDYFLLIVIRQERIAAQER